MPLNHGISQKPSQPGAGWPSKLLRYGTESIRRGTFFSSLARWLRARGYPFPMSWEAYRFDAFRRQRRDMLGKLDFSQVRFTGKKGLVSIILPAYNGEAYVREVIDSVLAQTYPDWELIAVNDGSTDSTPAILEAYAGQDARIRVVHQENKKLPGALNTGFSLAKGEFLTWVSCDNRLLPDFLRRLTSDLATHENRDMAYANLDLIGEDGAALLNSQEFIGYQQPFGSQHIFLPVSATELNIIPNNFINSAFLYRDRVSGLLGEYSLQRFTTEDYDYWMRVNALMNLRHADFKTPVYEYRFHPQSLTGQSNELKIKKKQAELMVYDDFRRCFYLTPMVWVLVSAPEISPDFMDKLANQIQRSGQILLTQTRLKQLNLPKFGVPVVLLQIMSAESSQAIHPPAHSPSYLIQAVVQIQTVTPPDHNSLPTAMLVSFPAHHSQTSFHVASRIDLLLAVDTAARARYLERNEPFLLTPPHPALEITVVICTHKLIDPLYACIESIARQDFAQDRYEIIVVNNNPSLEEIDACVQRARLEWFTDRQDQLRLLHCPIPGLSHARNAGMSEASGEIILFIDDDAAATPNLLSKLWQSYNAHPEAGVIGGKILLRDPEPRPAWYRPGWKRFWSHFDPPYETFQAVQRWQDYPWGANWSARREALLAIGGFRSSYGRQGSRLTGGEEVIAARLIQQMGWSIGIEPAAVVRHHVDPARFSLRYVWDAIWSARRTWYQTQTDGYFPMEIGFKHSARRIFNALKSWREESVVKVAFTFLAELATAAWVLKDFLLRLRKPG